MTIRPTFMALTLGVLAACQPAVPDSGAGAPGRGVGFDAPSRVQSQALPSTNVPNQTTQIAAQRTTAQTALARPAPQTLPAAASTAAPRTTGLSTGPQNSVIDGRTVLNASPSNPAPGTVSNAGISDENDFDAVAGRQSIESDKARIEANRAQYAVVQPTALPSRDGASQPNVVAYALSTQHPRGTQVHRRFGFASAAKTERNCAAYSTPDEAQIDFLTRGGPIKDRKALDPDGDGYACGWNPAKYRK